MSKESEFSPKAYEDKWKKKWLEDGVYKTPEIDLNESGEPKTKKYYSLYLRHQITNSKTIKCKQDENSKKKHINKK